MKEKRNFRSRREVERAGYGGGKVGIEEEGWGVVGRMQAVGEGGREEKRD